MLGSMRIVAFVPSKDPPGSRPFFEEVLGLKFVSQDDFAMVVYANGVMVRVTNVSNVKDFRPAPFTILGWRVDDIEKIVRQLQAKGVVFVRYPGMEQDSLGIWSAPGGAKVAWFKDPDGNLLSVSQHP
jgi:catechol 2,3-dioxygenase-like lactoylglutathione lyase family enzyme